MHTAPAPARRKSSSFQPCKVCREPVNLDDEGTQYSDGTAAHDHCHDADAYRRANEADAD